MISRLIALLLGKPTPESIPVTHPLPSSQSRYRRTVAHMVCDVRRCDSIEQVIEHLRDRSGYVREAAVERAVELGSPTLLPALAGRLNDWVIPVRNRAQDAVLTMLAALSAETDADVAMQLLPEVQRLKDKRFCANSMRLKRWCFLWKHETEEGQANPEPLQGVRDSIQSIK
jgi:hypothetical protein